MDKADALKRAIEKKKEKNIEGFQCEVENLVWSIEKKSNELRDLKKKLKELTFEEIEIPDVSDCLK